MEPFVGASVNYHCIKGEEYLGPGDDMILPAIITRVYKGNQMQAVDLTIFTNQPSSLIARRTSVSYGLTNGGGWSWPTLLPRVAEAVYNKDTVEPAPIADKPLTPQPVRPTLTAPKVG